MRPRLYVLKPSHYCERARWGLEHQGIDFEEVVFVPGAHFWQTRRLAPKSTLPILETDGGIVQGSGAILDWAGLGGGDGAIEKRVEERLGVLGRRMVYAGLLNETPTHAAELLFDGARGAYATMGRLLWPLTRRLMIRRMQTQLEHIPALEQAIAAEITWVADALAGRPYFVGDRFGRTDLTVASLLAPLVLPEGCAIYAKVEVPPVLQELFIRWREHSVFAYVRRIYATHR